MKRISTLLFCALLSTVAFGQSRAYETSNKAFEGPNSSLRVPTDTLIPGGGPSTGWVLWNSISGGYVGGNNGYGDMEKAQYFLVQDEYNIEGGIFWFGGKDVQGDGAVDFNIYDMDGTANTTNDSTDIGPGTILLSESSGPVSAIDTASSFDAAHVHMFAVQLTVMTDYAMGVNFNALYATSDTLGLVASEDGDDVGFNSSFESWSDGSWYSIYSAWGLDIFFGIFPIVDLSLSSIEEQSFINGVKAQVYPNPAASQASLKFEIENNAEVQVIVYDATGRVLMNDEFGSMSAGSHEIKLPVENWNAGVYYYTVIAGNYAHSLTSKFVLSK